jgi:hypothetical protein
VPEGFKGKFRVEMSVGGPFEVSQSPPEWFSVE